MTDWTRTTSGNCEAGGWSHVRRARWQGPPTPSGGDLWCGTCKRQYERAATADTGGVACTCGRVHAQPFSVTFEDVTAWLRENHRMRVIPNYSNSGLWQCSCGAENAPGTRLTLAQAEANADRHLRAARKRFPGVSAADQGGS